MVFMQNIAFSYVSRPSTSMYSRTRHLSTIKIFQRAHETRNLSEYQGFDKGHWG